ncbi:heavy metal-associated domain-containing protein [Acidithiobacillus sp.]|uniref:CopZ family metallochaperone n=1 Tax=Acidithiobacillus sp. TaxID=1872118 RepID=UPI0032B00FA5
MAEIQIEITGMTCGHCVRAVTQALEQVPGVEKVEVQREPKGEARVWGNAERSALLAAIEEEGYQAR